EQVHSANDFGHLLRQDAISVRIFDDTDGAGTSRRSALDGYVTDRQCEPDFSVLIHGQLLSAFFPYDEVMAVARYSWERNLTLCLADFVIDGDLCLAPRNNAVQFHLAVGIGRFRG